MSFSKFVELIMSDYRLAGIFIFVEFSDVNRFVFVRAALRTRHGNCKRIRTHVQVQEIAENRSTTQFATRVRTSTRFFTPKATQFEVRLQEAMFHTAQSIVQSIETNSTSNVSVELGGILKKTTNIGK